MTTDLMFRVVGTPAPQGSKKIVADRMIESSKLLVPWRNAVALTVREEMLRSGQEMITGPVAATLVFLFRRPTSLPKRVQHHVRQPDLDKITRSTLDAIKDAGLLRDDSQVCSLGDTRKEYAKPGVAPGVWIKLVILE